MELANWKATETEFGEFVKSALEYMYSFFQNQECSFFLLARKSTSRIYHNY